MFLTAIWPTSTCLGPQGQNIRPSLKHAGSGTVNTASKSELRHVALQYISQDTPVVDRTLPKVTLTPKAHIYRGDLKSSY